jgi:hypothetical protein
MYKCRKIILNTNISSQNVNVHPGDIQFLPRLMESHRLYLQFNMNPIKTEGYNLNAQKKLNIPLTKSFYQARNFNLLVTKPFRQARIVSAHEKLLENM